MNEAGCEFPDRQADGGISGQDEGGGAERWSHPAVVNG